MTIAPSPSISVILPTGTAVGPWPTGWTYSDPADVTLYVELGGEAGAPLTQGVDYLLAASDPRVFGGEVTLMPSVVPVDGWTENHRLILMRRTVRRQAIALPDVEGHKPRATERGLDHAMRIAQEDADALDRALKAPPGETGLNLPSLSIRRGRWAFFDPLSGDMRPGEVMSAAQPASDLGAALMTRSAPDEARAVIGLEDDQIQSLALAAIELRPETFRRDEDGSDWAPAFERLELARRQFANVGTRLIRTVIGKDRYYLRSGISLSIGLNHSLFVEGAGNLLDGSRFEVDVDHWADPNEPVITITGDNGINTMAQFHLGNFAIAQPPGGPAKIGLRLKDLNAPPGASWVHDLYIEGFKISVEAPNTRLVVFDRVVIWAESIDNAEPYKFVSDGVGTFAGDVTFNECQVVTGIRGEYTPNGSTFLRLEARNGGETRGFTFNRFIGYHADVPVKWTAETGGVIADVWFNPGTQFDKIVNTTWDIRALSNGAGSYGTIDNINFIGVYFTSINTGDDYALMFGARGDIGQINDNSGNVSEVTIAYCQFYNFPRKLYFSGVVGLNLLHNNFYGYGDPLLAIDAIVLLEDCHAVSMAGNVARVPSGVIDYAVIIGHTCTQIDIAPWQGAVTAIRDWSGIMRPRLSGGLQAAADDAAAAALGVPLHGFYENGGGVVRIRKA